MIQRLFGASAHFHHWCDMSPCFVVRGAGKKDMEMSPDLNSAVSQLVLVKTMTPRDMPNQHLSHTLHVRLVRLFSEPLHVIPHHMSYRTTSNMPYLSTPRCDGTSLSMAAWQMASHNKISVAILPEVAVKRQTCSACNLNSKT